MSFLVRSLLSCWLLALSMSTARAQAEFPPPALKAASSYPAAMAALGVGRAEFSTHLLLDVPEVAVAGTAVPARIASEIPGTTLLVLLRAVPVAAADARPAAPSRAARKPPATSAASPAPVAPPPMPSVLVAARQYEPGEKSAFSTDFPYQAREIFTLFAFAQGRWYSTAREIKPARAVDTVPQRVKPGSSHSSPADR